MTYTLFFGQQHYNWHSGDPVPHSSPERKKASLKDAAVILISDVVMGIQSMFHNWIDLALARRNVGYFDSTPIIRARGIATFCYLRCIMRLNRQREKLPN